MVQALKMHEFKSSQGKEYHSTKKILGLFLIMEPAGVQAIVILLFTC
jgi:hypothetical protein